MGRRGRSGPARARKVGSVFVVERRYAESPEALEAAAQALLEIVAKNLLKEGEKASLPKRAGSKIVSG